LGAFPSLLGQGAILEARARRIPPHIRKRRARLPDVHNPKNAAIRPDDSSSGNTAGVNASTRDNDASRACGPHGLEGSSILGGREARYGKGRGLLNRDSDGLRPVLGIGAHERDRDEDSHEDSDDASGLHCWDFLAELGKFESIEDLQVALNDLTSSR
jgi:hypothetical protein